MRLGASESHKTKPIKTVDESQQKPSGDLEAEDMHSMQALPAHQDHHHQQQQQQQHQQHHQIEKQHQHQLELHQQTIHHQAHHQHQRPELEDQEAKESRSMVESAAGSITMTILEPLDHSQHVVHQSIEEQHPSQVSMDQANQQQQPSHVVQHLVLQQQQQQQQQHSPQFHQLQPATQRTLLELTSSPMATHQLVESRGEPLEQHDSQAHQQQVGDQSLRGEGQGLVLRQRPQIEGIVADGGGPIVQWLLENYEIAEGESLPRSTVYNHYLAHCRQLQMASVNAASFGKLIRSVFVGLKTRRLGTRGHSKYHYFGVRAKSHIRQELLQHQESASCSRDENSNHNTENTGSDTDSLANGMDCARLSGSANSISNSNSSATPTKRAKRENGGSTRRASQQHNSYGGLNNHEHQYAGAAGTNPILDTTHTQAQPEQHQPHQPQEQVINGTLYTYNGLATTNGHNQCHHIEAQPVIQHQRYDYTAQPISHRDMIDFRNYLGANWATLVDEHWPDPLANNSINFNPKTLTDQLGVEIQTESLLVAFEARYRSYYKRMVELLSELKFSNIEKLWHEFWRPPEHETNHQVTSEHQSKLADGGNLQTGTTNGLADGQFNIQPQSPITKLTFHLMFQLTSQPAIVDRINRIDYNLYEALETFLLPDMLSPVPRPLIQHIRLFAKNIGIWVEQSVKDYNLQFVTQKSTSARAFGYSLRRCTSLNHLSTASRAVWEKRSSLAQMSMDLLRVDLRDIEHQVSLMGNGQVPRGPLSNSVNNGTCNNVLGANNPTANNGDNQHNSENYLVQQNQRQPHPQQLFAMQPAQLIQNFLALLEDPYPANSWPDWCRNLVESRVSGMSLEEARNFIFKWNFYISLIMKELTLKSAPSLGSFQLIRLLFDEYIYYLVVYRLAQAQHKTPAQLLQPNSNQ